MVMMSCDQETIVQTWLDEKAEKRYMITCG